ncbi:exporter of polyketide antibiotics [Nocardiopsis oceani]
MALRRDRFLIAVWTAVTAGGVLGGVAAAEITYPTAQDRQERWEQLQTVPMFVLFQGRAFADTAEALAAQQAFAVGTMCAALGAVLLVVRGTRAEESSGRRELLGGLPLGRHADLAAALTIALSAGVVLAALIACGLLVSGMPVAGSVALALVTGMAVWTGAGLAALAAQLTTGTGRAVGLAFGAFYCLHLFRGLGAMTGEGALWMTWLVPQGWWENLRPFADEQWWVLLPALAWILLTVAAAFVLADRRDLGVGVLPQRPGRARGAGWLRSVSALTWRLDRAPLAGWAVAVTTMGLAMGYVGTGAMAEYADMPWVRAMASEMGVAPADTFFTYVIFVFVFPVAAHALFTALRIRREETAGTAELLLSGPTGRSAWAVAHVGAALAAPVVLLAALGTSVGLGSGLAGGQTGADIARFTVLTLSLAPAVWVVVGATVLVQGLVPRLSAAVGWTALGVGIVTEIAVKIGLVPELLFLLLSPFAHVNPFYRETAATYPLLMVLAAALLAAGVWALRRRDLPV